jgi:hypothetical protein
MSTCRLPAVAALLVATASLHAPPAQADPGLAKPDAASIWPQLQLRLSLQSLAASPLGVGSWALLPASDGTAGSLRAAALYGDVVLAAPRIGQFRATSGLVMGSPTGASPLSQWSATGALPFGVSLSQAGAGSIDATGIERATRPYLGLGYTSLAWWPSLSLVADVGLVSENFSALGQWARAAARNQSFEQTLREMRWTPVVQVGLRWAF